MASIAKAALWFDILGRLVSRDGDRSFAGFSDELVSAAGWIDREHLLVASETALWRFNVETGARERVVPVSAELVHLRSNDGRADPWEASGSAMMGKNSGESRGASGGFLAANCANSFRHLDRQRDLLRRRARACVFRRHRARHGVVARARSGGRLSDEPRVFLQLGGTGFNPDGAVVDPEGRFWNAQWGAGGSLVMGRTALSSGGALRRWSAQLSRVRR